MKLNGRPMRNLGQHSILFFEEYFSITPQHRFKRHLLRTVWELDGEKYIRYDGQTYQLAVKKYYGCPEYYWTVDTWYV